MQDTEAVSPDELIADRRARHRLAEAREFQGEPEALAAMELDWGPLRPEMRVLTRMHAPVSTRCPVLRVRCGARQRGAGRPRARRAASQSAGGGSSGDPDEPEPGESRRSNLDRPLAVNRHLSELFARIGVVA